MKVPIGCQQGQDIALAELDKQGIDGSDQYTPTAAGIADPGGCDVVLLVGLLRSGLLLGKSRTSGPWRWTPSCPGTTEARTTSATCRASASAAMPASAAMREAGCVFCGLEASGRVLLENELALCIADTYPVTPGHSLVIPRWHGSDGLALHQPE